MNKQLLSFTALVAVGALGASGTAVAQQASKPTISVGGYMSQGVRFVDNADAVGGRDTGGFAAWQDSEIHFRISGMLDNGISIGGGWELEGTSEDGVSATSGFIDEARVWLRGGFGELRLGQDDGAGQLMTTGYMGSWATQNGLNLSFDKSELVPAPAGYNNSGPAFTTRVDLADSDHTKVTYISPRFGGFQVGGSYARDLAPGADVEIDQTTTAAFQDFYVAAANFDRKFGNFRLGVGVAYATMDAPITAGQANTDPTQIGGGVLLEFGPVRVAGGWNITDEFNRSAATSNEGSSYDVGVRYSFGAHRVGLAYMGAETEAAIATAGDDEHSVLWATHSMTLGPGVAWRNTIEWADWDGEGTAATADNDGWGAATELALRF